MLILIYNEEEHEYPQAPTNGKITVGNDENNDDFVSILRKNGQELGDRRKTKVYFLRNIRV